ncbi:YheC/YheD family endospore coat-associated protein [Tepidibacillus decaturensis]|uniref:ATP-grasp domain-containing protein n=1 Tax=Tepidibacillus decaturensis TaxID=1413211 RepID=A0A135L1R0_9BACI|nr:YheC/YheD family protein [Tepidibacillus decaturensis]KXG42809.1 hypothetical protein U473_01245 [Tepidibacillus decaturensis]
MNKPILGIMVGKIKNRLFFEKGFYQNLQLIGKQRNILVYVFYPDQIDWKNKRVRGFQFNLPSKKWVEGWFPIPHFVYDRIFTDYSKYRPYIERMKKEKQITFLSEALHGKWQLYQILSANPIYKEHLPKTDIFKGVQQLFTWLDHFPIILKPIGGSHGKGIIRVQKKHHQYEIVGRNQANQKIQQIFLNRRQLSQWILNFISGKKYIIQQYLDLTTKSKQPYDIRVLVQKNYVGRWEITGMAARIGDSTNITSNLHGGGTVQPVNKLLLKEFGVAKANKIQNLISSLSESIPPFIESNHGHLFEVGLDLGINRQGKVWVIEANSKPGRQVFSLLGEVELSRKSMTQPIEYMEFLFKEGGSHFNPH